MTKHILEVEEKVLREAREISLDTASQRGAHELFRRVADYLGDGVQYPREATIAYSWLQKTIHVDHETWVARAEISLHPPNVVTENPHAAPMDNQVNEQAG